MQPDRIKILVVDDEQIIRDGCTRILAKEGWEIVTASDGQEGLEALGRGDFALMLLDLMMPGIDGFEVLERMPEISPDTIVIVITGYATVESAVEAMKKGAYDFISKPFTPDQLRLTVQRGLERRALIMEAERLKIEREKDLRAIATEKSRLKTVLNCMADGVLVADREGRVVLNNPAAIRLLNIDRDSLEGSMLGDFEEAKVLDDMIFEMLHKASEKIPCFTKEFQAGRFYVRALAAPVEGDNGEILGSVTVLHDITYLKELDQMKSDFVAMVSHELKSPLSAVRQQLLTMIKGLAGELTNAQKELLTRAERRLSGLVTLIEDLLDISKIEAGTIVQRKEPLDMAPLIRSVVDTYRPEAEKKGVQLLAEVPEVLPEIMADSSNMEEVITNLLNNAINYTFEGGRVTVRTFVKKRHLVMEVEDTGIGIAPEDQKRIFDKFYRVRSDRTRHVVGTGLGLPIVKGIVEAHLGTIEVESEPNIGSTFRVVLPLP